MAEVTELSNKEEVQDEATVLEIQRIKSCLFDLLVRRAEIEKAMQAYQSELNELLTSTS